IELLEAAVLRIKLSLRFSLNDHTESYITVLIEKGGSITMTVKRAGNEPDTDKSVSRRDDTSLQDVAIIITAVRDAGGGEDVTMKVMLPRLIDTAVFIFNLAFLTVTETAAAP
ncbi:hypothetical protein BDBG_18092, partial [Blastomyces gilchristii SLH14081]